VTLPAGGADPAAVEAAMRILGDVGRPNEPIGPLTTYRVGGAAAIVATAGRIADLSLIAAAAAAAELPILVIGRGSNLLIADAGFAGLAVVLDTEVFGTLDVRGSLVVAGGALALPALARRSVAAGLAGMEWAVGVPGSVGGGIRMNAGGHGSDMAATFRRARVLDLGRDPASVEILGRSEVNLGYRSSALRSSQVVIDAELALTPGDPGVGQGTIRDIVRWRREHQPGGQNAGSVFVNPATGASAGWLIEASGLKGRRLGTAAVSDKHANFIQADPAGSADDVVALMRLVQHEVERQFGVRLRTENRLVGVPNSEALQEG
jgi:UDP-N-acetylmuramate dehydrogenase